MRWITHEEIEKVRGGSESLLPCRCCRFWGDGTEGQGTKKPVVDGILNSSEKEGDSKSVNPGPRIVLHIIVLYR